MTTNNQLSLRFDCNSQLEMLHSGHNSGVAVTNYLDKSTGMMHQSSFGKPFDDAAAEINLMQGVEDLFIGQNAIKPFSRKCVSNVTHLTSFWLDLDYTNDPKLKHLSHDEFVDKFIAENKWLPIPTYTTFTGRNSAIVWVIDKSMYIGGKCKSRESMLSNWQSVITKLVDLTKAYGSDVKCKDAARHLRVVGSVNSKSDKEVTAKYYGNPVSFKEMRMAVAEEHYLRKLKQPKLVKPIKAAVKQAIYEKIEHPKKAHNVSQASLNNLKPMYNWYRLAATRMSDIKKLAADIGTIRKDRWQWLYCYSVEATRFCRSAETLLDECIEFAQLYLDQSDGQYSPDKIANRIVTAANRFGNSIDDLGVFVQGSEDKRYKHKTQTVVDRLGITSKQFESLGLETLKPRELILKHKLERIEAKRRADGVKSMADYNDERAANKVDKVALAKKLYATDLSVRQIAAKLGVSKSAINRYVNEK